MRIEMRRKVGRWKQKEYDKKREERNQKYEFEKLVSGC